MVQPTDFSYQLTQIPVAGVGNVNAQWESTSGVVAQQYLEQVTIIYQIFAKTSGETITGADAAAVTAALNNLKNLAQNGVLAPTNPNDPASPEKLYFLNVQMARNLDVLLRSFGAVGVDTSGALSISQAQLTQWKDLSLVSPVIQDVLTQGLSSVTSNRSLQALIELDYVKTANELLEDKMSALETALGVTKDVLNTLANIQEIHNKLVVSSKASFTFDYDVSANRSAGFTEGDWYRSYKSAASAYFGTPVIPKVALDIIDESGTITPRGISMVNNLINLRTSLEQQIQQLSTILSAGQKGENSLYGQLKKVVDDLNANFQHASVPITTANTAIEKASGLTRWLLDKYDSTTQTSEAGNIQTNITKAISAGENLNDTQKEDVRNFLFLFEEYYKSASNVLQKITQIIEKMAQGVRGS